MTAEFIEHIEQFLDGQITREELENLASKAEIEDLDKEIAWVQNTRTAIEVAGLREQLQDTFSKEEKASKTIRFLNNWRPFLAIAATILILAIVFLQLNKGIEEQNLYAQYEYIDPGLPMLMSQSDDHLLYDALTYYGEGNYETAIAKLKDIQDSYQNNDTLDYYLGASLLYQGQANEASPYFEKIASKDKSPFQEQAEWLLVVAALKVEELSKVSLLLTPILDSPEHLFFEEAQKLQKDLQNP